MGVPPTVGSIGLGPELQRVSNQVISMYFVEQRNTTTVPDCQEKQFKGDP